MRSLWLIFILQLLANICQAAPTPEPALSLENPYSIQWHWRDDPVELRNWMKQQLATLNPLQDPTRWAIVAAESINLDENPDFDETKIQLLIQSLTISKDRLLPKYTQFLIRSAHMNYENFLKFGNGTLIPTEVQHSHFLKQIELARQLGLETLAATKSVNLGQFLMETGRDGDGLKLIHKSMKEISAAPDATDIDLMNARFTYAMSLSQFNAQENSQVVFRDLEQQCSLKKMRTFCLDINLGYAQILLKANQELSTQKAIEILKSLLPVAETLKNDDMIAGICTTLVSAYLKEKNYLSAQTYGLWALAIYEKYHNTLWLADTQKKLAAVMVGLNQPEQSLQYLDKAARIFPEDYYWDHITIARTQAAAYRDLQQYEQSFERLQVLNRLLKEVNRHNQTTEIAQYLSLMNLQLEEEQSRSLSEMELLQKQEEIANQDKLNEQRINIQIVNWIWTLSGFCVVSGLIGLAWLRKQNRRVIYLNRHLREQVVKRFLPPALAEKVSRGEAILDETPVEQNITVVFCRLVGLDMAIEDLGPRVIARLLGELMQTVTDIASEHRGCFDKLHQGTFLVLFGTPLQSPPLEQVQDALNFSQAIIKQFHIMRESWPSGNGWHPDLAIGIHQGPALVGVFGGKRRADYTAIGQTVNLAARIEAEAKPGEIVFSESVEVIYGSQHSQDIGEFRLKGISQPQKLKKMVA